MSTINYQLKNRFSDIHTHVLGHPNSLLSTSVQEVESVLRYNAEHPADAQDYSLQLHPWHLRERSEIEAFEQMAHRLQSDPHFVAIGECGLDAVCNTPLSLQQEGFMAALNVARELHRPVIIHCVRHWAAMQQAVRTVFPNRDTTSAIEQPIIIHGFRKGPELARQLIAAGFSISLGKHHHPDLPGDLPDNRIYHETDEVPSDTSKQNH